MSKFKVGDKVKCAKSYVSRLPNEKPYLVEAVDRDGVWVRIPGHRFVWYDDDCFTKYEEPPQPSSSSKMTLPEDAAVRKTIPMTTGLLDYFPLALAAVANASYKGNLQHHSDKPLHWDKTKSNDHSDCITRHLVDRGKFDTDGVRHSVKLAWRALALAQLELEEAQKNGEKLI